MEVLVAVLLLVVLILDMIASLVSRWMRSTTVEQPFTDQSSSPSGSAPT